MMKKLIVILAIVAMFGASVAFAEINMTSAGAPRPQHEPIIKNYQEAKTQYQAAKTQYEAAKNEWETAKKSYIAQKNQTRNNATALMLEKGKIHLNKTISDMISHLELVKSKVTDMKVLSDAERATIIADLDADISNLTALQGQIKDINTANQLKSLAEKIKNAWTASRKGVARAVGRAEKAQAGRIITQAENVSANLQNRIKEAKAKGVNTAEFEALLASYNSQVALAKQGLATAGDKISAGDAEGAQASLKDARDQLKEASKMLKDIVKKGKETAKDAKQQNKPNPSSTNPPGTPLE